MCTYNAAKYKAHSLLEGFYGPKTGLTECAMGFGGGWDCRDATSFANCSLWRIRGCCIRKRNARSLDYADSFLTGTNRLRSG